VLLLTANSAYSSSKMMVAFECLSSAVCGDKVARGGYKRGFWLTGV
jgi:hypothetical protein